MTLPVDSLDGQRNQNLEGNSSCKWEKLAESVAVGKEKEGNER
jgi:hypothetical protein